MGITWTHLESLLNPSGPSEVPYFTIQTVMGQELFLTGSGGIVLLCDEITYIKRNNIGKMWLTKN